LSTKQRAEVLRYAVSLPIGYRYTWASDSKVIPIELAVKLIPAKSSFNLFKLPLCAPIKKFDKIKIRGFS